MGSIFHVPGISLPRQSAFPELSKGLILAWSAWADEVPTAKERSPFCHTGTINGAVAGGPDWSRRKRQSVLFDGTNDDISFTRRVSLEPTHDLTMYVRVKPTSSTPGNFKYLLSKVQSPGFDTSYGIDTGSSGGLRTLIYHGGGTYSTLTYAHTWSSTRWDSIAAVVRGVRHELWVNGALVASGTANSSNISYSALYNTTVAQFGDASLYFGGEFSEVLMWNRGITPAEVVKLSRGDIHPLTPYSRRVARVPGAVTLTIQDALHSHAADNLTLTQVHSLVVQDATHSHSADNLALTQVHSLAIDDALHAHTADNLALTQVHTLVIADALHAHAADNVVLDVSINLVIQDATHSHAADSLALTQVHVLAIDDALHSHAADALALTQVHVLVIADALHAHYADAVVLSLTGVGTAPRRATVAGANYQATVAASGAVACTITESTS